MELVYYIFLYIFIHLNIQKFKFISSRLRSCLALDKPFIIAGDFNARHTSWGDSIISFSSTRIHSFMSHHRLTNLNHHMTLALSLVCLTLLHLHHQALPSIFHLQMNVPSLISHLVEQHTGLTSDHRPITIQLNTSRACDNQIKLDIVSRSSELKWNVNYDNVNWNSYSIHAESILSSWHIQYMINYYCILILLEISMCLKMHGHHFVFHFIMLLSVNHLLLNHVYANTQHDGGNILISNPNIV